MEKSLEEVRSRIIELRSIKRMKPKEKAELKRLQSILRQQQLDAGETIVFKNRNGCIELAFDYYMNLRLSERRKLEKLWKQ